MDTPIMFPGVQGHSEIQARLSRAMARGRLHHALMFVGPPGVGKATVARGLACALACTETPGVGCGTCVRCRRLLNGRHTDLQVIEPTGKGRLITAGQAEELALRCLHAPFEGPAHVVVIDEADRLHEAAANKLLKAIEEPRPGVYFVLVTDNLEAMLPTLISRCTVVEFGGLGDDDVRAVLEQTAAELGEDLAADRTNLAVHLAAGSAGAAISLATDPELDRLRTLVGEFARTAAGGARCIFAGTAAPVWKQWSELVVATPEPGADDAGDDEPTVIVVKGKGLKKKKAGRKKTASKAKTAGTETPAKQRAAAAKVIDLWLLHLRECLRGGAGVPGVPAPNDAHQAAQHVRLLSAFSSRLRRNPNVRLALEQTLLEMSS